MKQLDTNPEGNATAHPRGNIDHINVQAVPRFFRSIASPRGQAVADCVLDKGYEGATEHLYVAAPGKRGEAA